MRLSDIESATQMDRYEVKSIMEVQLNTQQISNLFSRAETMAARDPLISNRSVLGKIKDRFMGRDHLSAMKDAISTMKRSAATSRPMSGDAIQRVEQEFIKLNSTLGNQVDFARYKSYFDNAMTGATRSQSLIYDSLVAANGLASSGISKNDILEYLKILADVVNDTFAGSKNPISEASGMMNKITRDRLIAAWTAAKSPNDSNKISAVLHKAGFRTDQVKELYQGLGITDPAAADPAAASSGASSPAAAKSAAASSSASSPAAATRGAVKQTAAGGPVKQTAAGGQSTQSNMPPIRNADDVEVALGTLLLQANNFSDADKSRLAGFMRGKADELEGKPTP